MTEKRFKSENIKFSNFIVDLNSATSKGTNTTKYKSYDTNTKKKCDELTDLLNRLNDENEQLKEQWKEKRHEDINELSVIAMKYKALENENEQLKSKLERCRRKVERQRKDLWKYSDYFMNELNWDCDRIIEEVFR